MKTRFSSTTGRFIALITILAMTAAPGISSAQRGRGGDGGDRGGRGGGRFGGGGSRFGGGGGGSRFGGGGGSRFGGGGGSRFGGGTTRGGGNTRGGSRFGGTTGRGGGGRGGGGAASFLSRLDTNKNGMIDVNEQGRMRPLLERMAQTNSKINLSRPIRLSTLNSAFETMRNSRSQGRNSRGRSEPELEPLVAGFDDFEEYADIPGFGDDARLYDIPTTAADKKEAQRQISRADRNKDGVLDAQEVRRVGNWTSDPWKNDRNGDKKLTVAELAVRYAVRRMDRVKNGKSSNSRTRQTSSRTRGGTSRTSSRGGTTNNRMAGFMDTIFARYDRNRSGYLEKSEWSSFRSDPSAADKNKDSRISKKEFSDFMGSRFSRGGQQGGRTRGGGQTSRGGGMFTRGGGMTRGGTSRGGGDTGGRGRFGRGGGDTGGRGRFTRGGDTGGRGRFSRGGQSGGGRMMMMGGGRGLAGGRGSSGRGAPAEPAKSKGYKQSSPIDNLPDGLPSWYERNDANTDGQIAMHEFASKWDNRVLENFYEFDLNKDGLITPKEALEGVDQGARRGDYGSSSSGRSRDSRSSRSSRNSKSRRGSRDSKSASSSSSKTKSASANGPAKYIKAASGYLKSMDKNGDGSLDATEQANMKFYKKSDHNKDGKITVEELAKTMADSRK